VVEAVVWEAMVGLALRQINIVGAPPK